LWELAGTRTNPTRSGLWWSGSTWWWDCGIFSWWLKKLQLSAAFLMLAQEQVVFGLQFYDILLQIVMLCNCWSSQSMANEPAQKCQPTLFRKANWTKPTKQKSRLVRGGSGLDTNVFQSTQNNMDKLSMTT
jgi:hypothetical protein